MTTAKKGDVTAHPIATLVGGFIGGVTFGMVVTLFLIRAYFLWPFPLTTLVVLCVLVVPIMTVLGLMCRQFVTGALATLVSVMWIAHVDAGNRNFDPGDPRGRILSSIGCYMGMLLLIGSLFFVPPWLYGFAVVLVAQYPAVMLVVHRRWKRRPVEQAW